MPQSCCPIKILSLSNEPFVHPTAIVEDGAVIGAGSAIWHHAHVRAGATVGDDCVIGKNVFIDAGVVMGNRVKVQNNVSLYNGVILEDEILVGPSAVFTNDIYPRSVSPDWKVAATIVRSGASIGANATVVAGTEIGACAMVGAGTVIIADVAPHALMVGNPARQIGWVDRAGAVVSRDAEPPAGLA